MSSQGTEEQARVYNQWMAQRVARWRFARFAAMFAFAALGAFVWGMTRQFLLAFPLLGIAGVAFFFGLIAHDHLREIKRRRWKRLTPCLPPNAPAHDTAAVVTNTR